MLFLSMHSTRQGTWRSPMGLPGLGRRWRRDDSGAVSASADAGHELMIYLKQSLSVASYEGIRASVASGATTASVTTACNRILTARNVQAATITITPSGFETQPAETLITVRVSAPAASNSIFSGWFYDTIVIDGQATMMKEF